MNISDLKNSKYLKKEDCEPPILVTIAKIKRENVAQEGQQPDLRFAVYFQEVEKPLILNTTNGQLIARITGTEDDDSDNQSDRWIGQRIVLYNEPNVTYGGKLTGGIRVRAPKVKQREAPAGKQKRDWPEEEEDDNIPF